MEQHLKNIQLNSEQIDALHEMLSGKNIFLTGEAGTGKSTVLKAFREKCKKNTVFLAPTGVAAINLNGSTIHSFFMLKPGFLNDQHLEPIASSKKKALIKRADVIVIDEISMVRSDVFSAIDFRLRSLADSENKDTPFGGKQLIVVGDFYQLSPVVKSEFEERHLTEMFGGCFCFQTNIWENSFLKNIVLKEVHRQQDDPLFLNILNNIRNGYLIKKDEVSNQTCIETLNEKCSILEGYDENSICLCTTNKEAETINYSRLDRLHQQLFTFTAICDGKFNEFDYPTLQTLELKVGARVMILINKSKFGEFEHVNGDIGTITNIVNNTHQQIVDILLDNGKKCSIEPTIWENSEYVLERDPKLNKTIISQNVVGTFKQLPLKLAYAVTIHKSQGLTLDSVFIKLGYGCFAHGQLYTALSRCKMLKNMKIDRQIKLNDALLDPSVVNFHMSLEKV